MFRTFLQTTRALSVVIIFMAASGAARAHNPGLSSATVTLEEQEITALLAFNPQDLEALLEHEPGSVPLETLGRRALALSIDGAALAPARVTASTGENNDVELRVRFPRSPGATLAITSVLLGEMPTGHRQILRVQTAAGKLLASGLLSASEASSIVPLPASHALPTGHDDPATFVPHTFVEFLKLGVEHILTGYDHLLFLFGLLLVCDRFGRAIRIITAFTIAHSITLALATFDVVTLSPDVVEPLIAASIVYVGVENLIRGREVKWRTALTFAFGLIHGLGFAGVLREIGVGRDGSGVLVPLASFNLGVEMGQLAIAAVVLPVIWQLRKRPGFLRIAAPALSVLIVFAGIYWFLQRTLSA